MCGLCGVFGHVGIREKDALMHLQVFSQLRGTDSTGLALSFSEFSKKEPVIYKDIGGLENLIFNNDKLYDQRDWTLKAFNIEMAMSHHRRATIGAISEDNAHPFEFDKIIGCHNGTIFKTDLKKLKEHDNALIDSQILLRELDRENGDLPKVMENVPKSGAWALVWWHKEEKTLSFCRNDKRTLCLAYSDNEETIFWASEAWMLHQALKRAGVAYSGKVWGLKEDTMFVTGKDKSRKVKIIGQRKAPARGYFFQPPAVNNKNPPGNSPPVTMGYKGPKQGTENAYKNLTQEKNLPVPSGGRKGEFQEAYGETHKGTFVKKRKYLALIKDGCSCCGTPLDWDHRKLIRWLSEEEPLCVKCQAHFKEEIEAAETSGRSVH